ncbi:hypothetical protein F0170_09040 [Pseudomonas sp. MAFF 730085]|uniref:Uncharacterized protein n=1 Tax=Pseudomonas kitaguniensis TaxID=2607908 RepID=A0A5N7JRV8_9PSED|nr:hypothetical protein [Pseudomonas kitaguniensis]
MRCALCGSWRALARLPASPRFCGSGLARDAGNSIQQAHRVDAIASKPAPTIQALAAIAVTSTRMPSTARAATPTAARTGHGVAK